MFLDLVKKEKRRISEGINLIASENYPSQKVLELVGSVLSCKYAEGYPGNRYYAGCNVVDEIESLAIKQAMDLFGAEYANVQPHSGSQANQAVLQALLSPQDKILAMSMDSGGHLTHGHKKNFSGKYYNFEFYSVDPITKVLDYDSIENIASTVRPKIILAGGSAYPRTIDFERFSKIATKVGALLWVDMAHFAGLVAAKLIQSPVPFADIVTTTTHKTLRGPRGGVILAKKNFEKLLNQAIIPGIQGGPAMNIIAAKGQCFQEAMTYEFVCYQQQVLKNASCLAKELLALGYDVISKGTDSHLLLIDLSNNGSILTGSKAESLCESFKIYINKNLIPFDTKSPLSPSGIRLGVPAMTTQGALEEDMVAIARLIDFIFKQNLSNPYNTNYINEQVHHITSKFKLTQ